MARILYVWDADYPWDVRTEKVCLSLRQAGHEVHIAARNRAWRSPTEELPEGTVHRLPPWRWAGERIDTLLSFPAFISPRWYQHLKDTVRATRTELIITRDLPLCPTSLWVGRRARLPVVFDMAENYPALLQDVWDTRRQKPFDWLVRNPRAAARLERYCLPRVDETIVVVEESGARALRIGAKPDRLTVVSNTPPRTRGRAPQAETPGPPQRIRLVYMGLMETARGIGVLLEACALLARAGSEPELHLIGGGRDLPLLMKQAKEAGLSADTTHFHGYIPSHAEALDIVAQADVGVIPHFANEWANTTIPNKLFDYMAAGIAVVSSDAIPCARILRETGAGRVFRDRDSADLAHQLTAIADPHERRIRAQAGYQAVMGRYNWEYDQQVLLELVERSLKRNPAT